jgi:LPXTG-motif cell wall-anchored protein
VLYNVWYLFAASGVVMLIGTGIGFIRRRQRKPAIPPPADALASI